MIGLALEGGGVRGSYQAGVYMAMYELGIKIDGVCGTSIGALNGAIIASGHGEDLPKIWRSLSMGHVFGFSDPFIEEFNKKKMSFN
ncbi:MAG: patatin-like phospholipase family protein, partial [Bacilli bacterium]|nr:patatin-like phospholipase family protein [Bacilli bacterium]